MNVIGIISPRMKAPICLLLAVFWSSSCRGVHSRGEMPRDASRFLSHEPRSSSSELTALSDAILLRSREPSRRTVRGGLPPQPEVSPACTTAASMEPSSRRESARSPA